MKTGGLILKAEHTIRKHGLLTSGDVVLAGFSGGPDSSCLLSLLAMLRDRYRLTLHAVYVNHNLRPDEVPAEISFCEKFCEDLGIAFSVKSIDVSSFCREHKMNRQEAARQLRYNALQEAAFEVRANRIALAHTADDQAETLLMRIARGAGPAGLAGIPARRGNIIRPVIEIERREIEEFLQSENIVPVTDSSNLKADYFRNMVRLKIMPLLRQTNPNIMQSVCHTMDILQEEERYFEIQVTKTLMKLISRKTEKRIELFLSPLEVMDRVILRRLLRRTIKEIESLRSISYRHIEDIIGLIKTGSSGDRLILPKGIRIIRDYSILVMTTEGPVKIAEYELQVPGEAVIVGAGLVITAAYEENSAQFGDGKNSILLDGEKLQLPLTVRGRRPGDHFYPMGFGKTKKLQDFLVDQKVPRDERDSLPVVCSGQEIVWIAGHRGDDRFRVTDNTKKFIRLGIVKGKF